MFNATLLIRSALGFLRGTRSRYYLQLLLKLMITILAREPSNQCHYEQAIISQYVRNLIDNNTLLTWLMINISGNPARCPRNSTRTSPAVEHHLERRTLGIQAMENVKLMKLYPREKKITIKSAAMAFLLYCLVFNRVLC